MSDTMTMKIHPTHELKCGQIAQFTVFENKVFLQPCDGTVPIGIVVAVSEQYTNGEWYREATIDFGRKIHITTEYDCKVSYPVNATLYVNSEGKLTPIREIFSCPAVAMVVTPPTALDANLTVIWF